MEKLYRNRIDLAVFDLVVGWNLIRQFYPQEIEIFGTLNKPLETGNSHLMTSRKYPNAAQLLNRFNQALKRIKEKRIYHAILEKYGIRSSESELTK